MNAVNLPIGTLMEIPSIPFQEPVLIIALVMALVLVLPLLGRIVRVPDIILLILAGMLFGENGLGLLERGQAIEVWGTVGLLYIMFLAGLEINVQDFLNNRYRSLLLGLLSFAVPQGVGTLAAVWLLGFGWTKAILLGSMLASFTLLTYPQLSRLGLSRKASVTVTVGGTLITDTLALLVLAVIVELHGQEFSWGYVLRMALAFAAFLAVVLAGVPLLGRWFFRTVGRDGGAQFLFVLMVAFLAGSLSRLAGIEPIIGAFLAGFTLNRLVPPQSALMNRVEFVGRNLFIPFFLISVGMIVDPRVFLADRATWLTGAVMVVAVFASKWVASMIARRLLGYTRDEGWMIFGLTVTQAAATLAAVVVGCELEIFDDTVLNGTLMMILATCMVSPWITDYFGRRVALAAAKGEDPAGTGESGRLLVPVDNPATADRLMELGVLLRGRASHEPILPLRVVTTEKEVTADIALNERMMFGAISVATAADIPVVPAIRVASGVAEGIQRASVELRASTILLGWSHRSAVGTAVFGGIMDDILHACRARVVACRLPLPLNTISQVRLAIPPNAEREAGFAETMQLVWRLAGQVGASLKVYCADINREWVKQVSSRLKSDQKVEWVPAGGWADVRRMLLAEGEEAGAMRVALTAREGGVSWRPGLERLPQLLASGNLRTGNVVLIYPALPSGDDESCPLPDPGILSGLVSLGGTLLADREQTWNSILDRLLCTSFAAGSPEFDSVREVVRRAAADFPIELVKEVVLVHGHTAVLAAPRVYVAVHPGGVMLAEMRARVVLVLLGPEGGPPDRHLQVLSALARLVRDAEWVKSLINAEDEMALRRLLVSAMAP